MLALFNERARVVLSDSNLKDVFIREGKIEVSRSGHLKNATVIIIGIIDSMMSLGKALNGSGGTPQERLARNIAEDSDTDFRRRCLGALFEKWPRKRSTP